MKCDFEYCIYNKDFTCIAGGTRINHLGIYEECILVSFNEKALEKEKAEQLPEA